MPTPASSPPSDSTPASDSPSPSALLVSWRLHLLPFHHQPATHFLALAPASSPSLASVLSRPSDISVPLVSCSRMTSPLLLRQATPPLESSSPLCIDDIPTPNAPSSTPTHHLKIERFIYSDQVILRASHIQSK